MNDIDSAHLAWIPQLSIFFARLAEDCDKLGALVKDL